MDVSTFALGASGYPSCFLALADPPKEVFLRGVLPERPRVAIVGSRAASEEGRALSERLAHELSSLGIAVVSGGAIGIDAAAHAGAIRAKRPTVVVLPSPVTRPRPASHGRLFSDVLDLGGALISEHARDLGRRTYCTRNRLIAALADVVVVVEARARSGTTYTIDAARRLGRTVAAVPWSIHDPRGEGCVEILRRGGLAVASAADVLRFLGREEERAPRKRHPPDPILRALQAARGGPVEIDALAERAGLPTPELLVRVARLELEGKLERLSGGRLRALV